MNNKLNNRKWKPVYREDGSWYTGYQGNMTLDCDGYDSLSLGYRTNYPLCVERGIHHILPLVVKLDGYSRGRSAANFQLKDVDDNVYQMSMSGFYDLMRSILNNSDFYGENDGYFTHNFVQTKQGSNYFIAPYIEEEE